MELLWPKARRVSARDRAWFDATRPAMWGESFSANVDAGMDMTVPDMVYRNMETMRAGMRGDSPKLSEEQWRESEYYREGIEFDEDMNEARAQILAEDFDKRRKRDAILSRQTPMQKLMGFGVQMGVGFLDPVNYIPFIGQAAKLRMIGRFGSVGGRMLAGGIDAAVGNIVTTPFIGEDLKRRGEKITFEDYAVDTFMGAGVGMLFGGAGGAWAKLRGEKKADVINALALATDDVAEGRPVDVSPLLKDVVESGEMTHERTMKRLADQGLRVEEAGALIGPLERMAADSGMELDAWMRRHIADITVGGKADEGAIRFHAMYRSPAKTLRDFAGAVRSNRSGKESFYALGKIPETLSDSLGIEGEVRLPSFVVNHLDKRRPREADALLGEIYEMLGKADAVLPVELGKTRMSGKPFVFLRQNGQRMKAVVAELVEKKESVLYPTTIFSGKPDAVREWAAQRAKRSEASPGTGDHSSVGPGSVSRRHRIIASSDENIAPSKAAGKRGKALSQRVLTLQGKARNALPLELVETFDDLPEHIRAKAGERGMDGVRGVSDGRAVYLVADAFDSFDEAVKIWLHEQVGHVGLRGLLGDGVDDVLDRVFEHFGPERLEGIREGYGLDFANPAHRREAAEEMLAHMAERMGKGGELSEADRNLWESFKRWLLDALRDMGMDVEMSDDELRYLIQDAARWTMDGTVRKERGGHSVRYRAGGSNGAVEFLPDGRAHIRVFDGADLQEAGEALSRILSERFQHVPPASRPDWRTERPEQPELDPMETSDPEATHEETALLNEQRVQAMMEAGELSEQELAALAAADVGVQRAERWGAGYEAAVECIIKRGL